MVELGGAASGGKRSIDAAPLKATSERSRGQVWHAQGGTTRISARDLPARYLAIPADHPLSIHLYPRLRRPQFSYSIARALIASLVFEIVCASFADLESHTSRCAN